MVSLQRQLIVAADRVQQWERLLSDTPDPATRHRLAGELTRAQDTLLTVWGHLCRQERWAQEAPAIAAREAEALATRPRVGVVTSQPTITPGSLQALQAPGPR